MSILHDALFITAWLSGACLLVRTIWLLLTRPARLGRIIAMLALVAGMLALSRMA